MMKVIGLRVKEIREYKKLKSKHLAAKAGISAAEISHIESGNRNPGIDITDRLASALEVTLDSAAQSLGSSVS
jgi:transcriptional regulator with XRE-family HTH domain